MARLSADNTGTVFIGNYYEGVYPHNAIPEPPPPVTEGGGGENEPNSPNPIPQGDITYYYAGSQRIALRDANGVYFLLSDHLGSSSVVMDASGQVVEEGYYMPWGGERGDQGISTTDYGYTGQMQEGDIYFYNSRWYDPAIGRFMQADSIVPMASQGTQAFDRYAYVNNNPVIYRDENGHWISTVVGGIIGAAIGYGVQVYQNVQSGMEFTDALTTDISADRILAGAAMGALAGTFIPFAASAISTSGLLTTGTTVATTACADGDCTNEIRMLAESGLNTVDDVANSEIGQTIAREFTHNSSSQTVSIGSFDDYITVGINMNYTFFDMPATAWDILSNPNLPTHFWKGINTAFMNQQIAAGKGFVTVLTNPGMIGKGLEMELTLLRQSGYVEKVINSFTSYFYFR